ncbi:MAG TPA: type III polyketide synthase, partial [Dehalococcoidia bacterium]|nr:type III polyketide synthase [Dehalococcoidia bacterium]
MVRIAGTGMALPPYRLDAAGFRAVLGAAFAPFYRDLRPLLRMADRCGVQERYLALPVEETLRSRSLGERNRIYVEQARALGEQAARQALLRSATDPRAIDLVVTVSCTGYMLPSLDAYLVGSLSLRPDVRRLPITELGCLAGAAALNRAAELLDGDSRRTALVVAVELPSLTFQPDDGSMDNLVSALVFADGAGAAVLRHDAGPGLALLDSRSLLVPGTLGEMGFELREGGFHVVLSKDVPALLAGPFAAAASRLLADHGLTFRDLSFACIHPGGP